MSSQRLISLLFLLSCVVVGACSSDQKGQEAPQPASATTFAIPGTVIVATEPYLSVDEAINDAENIDWGNDTLRANAATLSYAAQELGDHLSLLGASVRLAMPSESVGENEIFLIVQGHQDSEQLIPSAAVDYSSMGEQGFEIGFVGKNIYVAANTRIGVLYGVYRLLEHLGFAWDSPGEIAVPQVNIDQVEWKKIQQVPRIDLRGFWIFGEGILPDDFAVWLARNRLNIAARLAPRFRNMLGIKEWGGGHLLLQQEFSKIGLFEQHPEWYSIVNGIRRPVVASGVYFNPAFGNAEAANYFADQMIGRLEDGDLKHVDVLNIWPADSRSSRFDQSASANNIGNPTDNLLTFYGVVAERFRQAFSDGQLSRRVHVGGISYYLTWEPPTNTQAVQNLESADYLHIFYLNERSWSGAVNSGLEDRDTNRAIVNNLAAWQTAATLQYGFIEYYNYSLYAALALNDFQYLADNHEFLTANKHGLFGYMHPLMDNPGPRRLTNELLAKLGWQEAGVEDRRALAARIADSYFTRRYGTHSEEWREVYATMAASVENAAEIFGLNSLHWVLFQHILWADPPYTRAEAVNFVSQYRSGGKQYLPKFLAGDLVQSNFSGLDESIRLQEAAEAAWQAVLGLPLESEIRAAMESDVVWFEAASSRYRLMVASSDYFVAEFEGSDLTDARERMRVEIAFLEASSTTDDTISPVDQRAFLEFHRSLAGIE